MTTVLFRALPWLPAALLCACSHAHYAISLRDGGQITTDSEPKFISKTGYYRYRALNGKDALVRADEVLHIQQQ